MPLYQLDDPNRGIIEGSRATTQAFLAALERARERKRQKKLDELAERKLNLDEMLAQSRMGLYEAQAEKARNPSVHSPHYIQQKLGELTTGSPYSPLGLPMETLTERQEYEDFATNAFGPGWQRDIPQALDIINKKFPVVTETGTPEPVTKKPVAPTAKPSGISPAAFDIVSRFLQPSEEYAPATFKGGGGGRFRGKGASGSFEIDEEPTKEEITPIIASSKLKDKTVIFKEIMKLRDVWPSLSRDEKLTAYQKLAEGFTAQDIIDHIKSQTNAK